MLLTFDRLRAKPTIFKAFTGVSLSEFETLLTQSTPLWVASEQQRLSRPDRQRALGGGCKPKFGLRDQLLVTLVWLRLYLGTETLGFLFGIDKATVSRYTRAILPVLRQVGDATLGWLEPPKRGQGKDLAAARTAYPDLFAIVDATEQPVERSQDAEHQKQHYSGKKKRTPAKSRSSSMSTASCGRSVTRSPAPCMTVNSSGNRGLPRRFPRRRSRVATPATKGCKTTYPITA
jgi:hypothetical protein